MTAGSDKAAGEEFASRISKSSLNEKSRPEEAMQREDDYEQSRTTRAV